MGFRLQRRLKITRGLGVNVSKSGGSLSYRTKLGAIGAKGISIKTGIPGVSFRKSWGKGSGFGVLVGLALSILALVPVIVSLLVPLVKFAFWLFVMAPINIIAWSVMTLFDLVVYLVKKRQPQVIKENDA